MPTHQPERSVQPETDRPWPAWTPERIRRVFEPRAVTIVGGSPRIGASVRLVTSLTESIGRFDGPIRVVNRSQTAVRGVEAIASTNEVDGPLGLTYLMVNSSAALDWLEKSDARRDDIDGIILYSGGFAEVGNDRDQHFIEEWAGDNDVPILGPQSLGLIRASSGLLGLCASMPAKLQLGSAAVLCQSGGVTGGTVRALSQRGVGLAAACSYGNGSIVTFIDLARALVAADDVELLGIHTEVIADFDALRRLGSEAEALGKPIVLTVAGSSDRGARAVRSHTASVATPRRLARGLCDQAGIIWADDIDEMVLGIDALHSAGARRSFGPGVGIFSGSGGGAIAITDALSSAGVVMVDPALSTVTRLRELGVDGEIGNPFDCGAAMLDYADLYQQQAAAFAEDDSYGIVCKVIGSSPPTHDAPAQLKQYADFVEAVERTGRVPFLATPVSQQIDAVTWPGVPWESGARRVATKLRILDTWARYRQRVLEAVDSLSAETDVEVEVEVNVEGESVVATSIPGPGAVTGPRVISQLRAPVRMPPSHLLESADEPIPALEGPFKGAVFVKSETGLEHRWLAGGVVGPLDRPEPVAAAVALLAARWGYPISITAAVANDAEYIVGVERLEGVGVVCSVGQGGVGAGAGMLLYRAPLSLQQCRRLVAAAVGFVSEPLARLAHWMVRLAEADPDFGSLEFNPVVFDGAQLIALDAKLLPRN